MVAHRRMRLDDSMSNRKTFCDKEKFSNRPGSPAYLTLSRTRLIARYYYYFIIKLSFVLYLHALQARIKSNYILLINFK